MINAEGVSQATCNHAFAWLQSNTVRLHFARNVALILLLYATAYGSARAEPHGSWRDYQVIMWQSQTRQQYAALRHLSITAGTVHLESRDNPARLPIHEMEPLLRNHLRWYVENIATDFYSAYHRWFPNRPVNWRFEAVKKLYDEDPQNPAALIRDPSLSDPKWLGAIRRRLMSTVRAQRTYRPLYYNLGDETGIADLSIFWDFDFSSYSLSGFRRWLKGQYGTLAGLNAEWDSHFTRWNNVMPMTTREAMVRADDNFAPWADFKAWMDVAFARTLRLGRDAVHAADPDAYAAIEGGQIPGWGGYDYSRLAHAVDVMELYDGGANLEIVRSLNPNMVILTTSSGSGPEEAHHVWRELLRGSRGTILWDPNGGFVGKNGAVGRRGREAASYLREIRSGLGSLLINSTRNWDPIAILYSPASMRTQWMLDWKPQPDAWSRRPTSASYEDASAVRDAMVGYSWLLGHMGLNPRFITSGMIARGELRNGGYRVLILPHVISLSGTEATEIRDFVKRGGRVIADVQPGLFDEHSRKLSHLLLADLFGDAAVAATPPQGENESAVYLSPNVVGCLQSMVKESCQGTQERLGRILSQRSVRPMASITDHIGRPVTDCELYFFRKGPATIIALQRDEMKPPAPGSGGRARDTSSSDTIVLTLRRPAYVYDFRAKHALGWTSRLELLLDPYEPTILSASPTLTSSLTRHELRVH